MTIRFSLVLSAFVIIPYISSPAQPSFAVKYDYAELSFPGARLTNANGINNNNVIVGSYFDSMDNVHGFTYQSGKFTAVNFPNATMTDVLGINDNGDIVGTYQLPGALNFHGFLRRNGAFTKIDDPKAKIGTIAFGINNLGTIVGSYDNAQGFVYANGAYQTWNAPQIPGEPHQTQLNGINKLGSIVGQVFTGGIWRGFWIGNGLVRFLEPSGTSDSEAMGVNGHGDIAGCHDAQAGFVAFAAGNSGSSGDGNKFPAQQSVASCISGINFARVIVGNYSTVSNSNAFLGVPALILKLSSPGNTTTLENPVHVVAAATGTHVISTIQVWINFKEVFHVKGSALDARLKISRGENQRFAVQAIDSTGGIAKVVDTITVR